MNLIDRPRFRNDLVAEPIEEDGHRFIDVVDPDTGTMFRFYEVEYSIACAMDGLRDVRALGEWAREELGVEPSPSELTNVITTLGDLGYLESTSTIAATYQPELVAGVVSAPRSTGTSERIELGLSGAPPISEDQAGLIVGDVELGRAGGEAIATASTAERSATSHALGPAGSRTSTADFDLPPPPASVAPAATLRPRSVPDQEDDGPTNLPPAVTADFSDDDVSVDLSDHLEISPSDVKEAVRASRVMKAVDLPADLQAMLDGEVASSAPIDAPTEGGPAGRAGAERSASAQAVRELVSTAVAPATPRSTSGARPIVELPRPPASISRPPADVQSGAAVKGTAVPSGTRAKRSLVPLYLALIALALVIGAFLVWTQVLNRPLPWESTDAPTPPPPAPTPVAEMPPPAPPPPPESSLVELAGNPADVMAGRVAVIADVVADGTLVAVGDQVVRFAASAAIEQRLKGLDYDIDLGVPREIEQLTKRKEKADAEGNAEVAKSLAARIEARTVRLEEKRKERQVLLAKVEDAIVRAPIAGVVAKPAKKGARVGAETVLATIRPVPQLMATFVIPSGKSIAVDAVVRVAAKAAPDKIASCQVVEVAVGKATVACPVSDGFAAGAEVVLQ